MSIPILGYPSKTAAAVALTYEGLSIESIAYRFEDGTTPRQIENLLYYAALAKNHSVIKVSIANARQLEFIARKRGITPSALCEKIMAIALRENLITAILDD